MALGCRLTPQVTTIAAARAACARFVLALACLAACAAGCAAREPTQLMLRIHTDLTPDEMGAYELTIAWVDSCGRDAVFHACYERTAAGGHCPAPDPRAGSTGGCADGVRYDPGVFRRDPFRGGSAPDRWEVSHGVVPNRPGEPMADLSRPVLFLARGFLQGNVVVTSGEVTAAFDRDHLRDVNVYLLRHCAGVQCPAGQRCTPGASCGDDDAGPPGTDASVPRDVPPRCDVACTPGTTRCSAGMFETCEMDPSGCPRWTAPMPCAGGMCAVDGAACCDPSSACGSRVCGTDACGRSCGTCPADRACNAATGHCECRDMRPPCNGVCCPAGRECSGDGTRCVCAGDTFACGTSCCANGQTCALATNTCCTPRCPSPLPPYCLGDGCGSWCGCGAYADGCDSAKGCLCTNPGSTFCPRTGPAQLCCPAGLRCTLIRAPNTWGCRQ